MKVFGCNEIKGKRVYGNSVWYVRLTIINITMVLHTQASKRNDRR